MKKLCALLFVAMSFACALGREVLPTGGANLTTEEGLVVFAGDVDKPIGITVCRDDGQCTGTELSAEKTVAVVAAPAGRYCIAGMGYETYGGAGAVNGTPEGAVCFAVEPGVITYFGHLMFATEVVGNTSLDISRWGFVRRDDAIRGQLDVSFPLLKDYKLRPLDLHRR